LQTIEVEPARYDRFEVNHRASCIALWQQQPKSGPDSLLETTATMPHSTNIPAAPSWSIEQSNGVTDLNIDVPFLMPKAPKTWKPGSIAYLKPPENSHGIHAVKRSFPESEDSGNMLCRFVVVLGYDKDDVIVAPVSPAIALQSEVRDH
jgi:hypothetical protein